MAEENSSNESTPTKDSIILGHIAHYVLQALIKEDVNAFAESELLQELLTYKLSEVAYPLMYNTISEVAEEIEQKKSLDLIKRAGGITQAKRISFRTEDQYNSFVALFFKVAEDHPELVECCDSEESFEKFMIFCIYEFRGKLDNFVAEIAREKTDLEYKKNLYHSRRKNIEAVLEVPSYADYIAERIDSLAGSE